MPSPFPEVERLNTLVFGTTSDDHQSMTNAMRSVLKNRGISIPYASMRVSSLGEVAQVLSGTHPIDIVHLFNKYNEDEERIPNAVYLEGCLGIAIAIEKLAKRKPWVVFGELELQPMETAFRSRRIHVEFGPLAPAVLRRIIDMNSNIAYCA